MFYVDDDPNKLGNGDLAIRSEKGALVALVYAQRDPTRTRLCADIIVDALRSERDLCREAQSPCDWAMVLIAEKDAAEARAQAAEDRLASGSDLLEALLDMVSDHASLSEATLQRARAAIAKATDTQAPALSTP